ncbi:MAG: DUF2157 domain-containing protein, partial [Lentisphaerae bacterium]|nr:DUF2157 domain-containing protein [Lentisphaerota bacterium]
IMVLGYNWDQLSRGARAVISFIPLAIAQALCGWMLGTGRRSAAWREGGGTLLVLALGASLALIAQTYNLGGTWQDFMLTWMLLSLPVVYLLQAAVPAMLFMAGVTAWLTGGWDHSNVVGFWPLLAAVFPFIGWKIRQNRYGPGAVFLMWALVICLSIALGFSLRDDIDVLWIQVYASFFAVLFLAGATWFGEAPTAGHNPFLTAGACGTAMLAFLLTFEWAWEHLARQTLFTGATLQRPDAVLMLVIVAALMLAAMVLWARAARRRDLLRALYGAFPIMTFVGYVIVFQKCPLLWLLFNAYFLALALAPLITGIRASRLGQINAGILLLTALILARFFDADFSLLAKGLVFILAGIVFLTINIIMLRRKGAAAQ